MPNSIEEIARGLTEAQRRLVLASDPDDITGEEGCGIEIVGPLYATARALRRKKLGLYTHGDCYGDMYWNLPLGLALRTHLQSRQP